MEFYAGIKNSRKARIYSTLLLSRRLCFVVVIILFGFIGRTPIFSIMLTIQFLYWLSLILIKPFDVVKDNIIEIANETFYMIFVCFMIHCENESKWTTVITYTFLYMMTLNTVIVCIISLSKSTSITFYSIFHILTHKTMSKKIMIPNKISPSPKTHSNGN